MEHDSHNTTGADPEATLIGKPEPGLSLPLFNREAVEHARVAVPLVAIRPAHHWSGRWVILTIAAGIVSGLICISAWLLYQRGQARPIQSSAASETAHATQSNAPNAPTRAPQEAIQPVAAASSQSPATQEAASKSTPPSTNVGTPVEQATLRNSFGEWLAATNARDVERQMQLYSAHVQAYYLTRNVSQANVRAEKMKVFGQAKQVVVNASDPEIKVAADGRTATMRFRKRYDIASDQLERSGEVLQELRWVKTPDGWKIIGERDLRVLH